MAYMTKPPRGYREGDRVTVTITGTLGQDLWTELRTDMGVVLYLPADAHLSNPPGRLASLAAGMVDGQRVVAGA